MHMADALLAPAVAATMYAASAAAASVSVRKLSKEDACGGDLSAKRLPTMAVMSALVFAGQMVNYTIPGTGSSGHLCGGMLLTALLGPYAGFLSMIVVLSTQCLFFADGGLMALGANVWNMAFYGCFVGYFLIYRPILRSKLFGRKRGEKARIILASVLGCVLTLQLGAFSVVVETSLSEVTDLPFGAFIALMQPIHLAIGLVEGAVTAAVLCFVYEARPELLMDVGVGSDEGRMSRRAALLVLAAVVVMTAGGFSLLASQNPDGLEWSLFGNEEGGYSANLGLDEENYGVESDPSKTLGAIQDKTAFLPDYSFRTEESKIGTSVSGLAGSAIVAGSVVIVCLVGRMVRKRRNAKSRKALKV